MGKIQSPVVCQQPRSPSTELRTRSSALHISLLLYPLFIYIHQHIRCFNFDQGFDFSIYAQIVHNFANSEQLDFALNTTLLGTRSINFFTHHFSPFLYIPSFIARYFTSAENSLFLLQLASIYLTLFGIVCLNEHNAFNSRKFLFLKLAFFILLPPLFIQNLSDIHDELFALPLITFIYLGIKKDSFKLIMPSALLLASIKETMLLVLFGFGIYIFFNSQKSKNRILGITTTFVSLFIFWLYTSYLPGKLFWPTFSAKERIADFSEMLNSELLLQKVKWFIFIFLPFLPIIVCNLKEIYCRKNIGNFLMLSPVIPIFFAIIVTNFPPLLIPSYYYSVIPSLVIYIFLLGCLKETRQNVFVLVLSIAISLILMPPTNIIGEARALFRKQDPSNIIREVIPNDSIIIADEDSASLFIRNKQTIRLKVANRNKVNFDYIVKRKRDIKTILSEYLINNSNLVAENDVWLIRKKRE